MHPQVIDEPVSVFHRLHELPEQIAPFLVLVVPHVGTLGETGVGQHPVILIEGVQITTPFVIGHIANQFLGALPGLGFADGAGSGQPGLSVNGIEG